MLFQQSGWLDLVEYRANRLHRHRLPLEARDDIDLDELTGRLQDALDQTMQPAHSAVWLSPQLRATPPGPRAAP